VTRCHPIGIDLEYHRVIPEAATILKHYIPEDDPPQAHMSTVHQQSDTFFNRWVCHEAYLKARGTGFTPSHAHPPSIHACDAGSPQAWSLWTFTPAPNYSAAIVTDAKFQQLQFHEVR
jgi:phosphopantetheinyl transferase